MRQRQALSVMLSGASVFLTGPPGAGKTFVLNEFIKRAKKQHRTIAVTASTGIAATHIGGTTIHSWSGLGIREGLSQWDKDKLLANNKLLSRYNSTDALVIDEVSMLHGHRLDLVNEVCKLLRKSEEPFGGMQIILVGDLFQLPPVNRGADRLDFVHNSAAWQELNPEICYLSEQHRQLGDGLLDLLEAMRRGEVGEEHEYLLQERLNKTPDEHTAITRLYAHNVDVETINQRHLAALEKDTKTFTMQTKGTAAKVEQLVKSVLAPETLELKIGAEVMFVANNFGAGFVNGTRGKVLDFADNLPIVELTDGREIKVEPHAWSLQEDGKKRAEVVQLPLRLAWAITIHKSQGMSLDAAEIDLSRTFTPGMGYVALSRVRSLDGVYLNGINRMALAMHHEIYEFDATLRQASELLATATVDEPDQTEESEAEQKPKLDEDLLNKLKQWRSKRAESLGMPAYIVAHNSVLESIAARPPQSAQALLGLKGFGPKKFETYGEELLALITSHTGDAPTGQHHIEKNDEGTTKWSAAEDRKLLELFQKHASLDYASAALNRPAAAIWTRLASLLQQENPSL